MDDVIIFLLVIAVLFLLLRNNKYYSKDIKNIEKSVNNIVQKAVDKIKNND